VSGRCVLSLHVPTLTEKLHESLRTADLQSYTSTRITKCKLDLVGVQVRWDMCNTKPAGDYIFSMERGMRIMN
jgi:hypothetical protein